MSSRSALPAALCALLAASQLGGCGGSSDVRQRHRISGTVSGAAAGGVIVAITGAANALTLTDEAGRYAFVGLPDGSYTLTPGLEGFIFGPPSTLVPLSGADATVNFTAARPVWAVGVNAGKGVLWRWNGSAWESVTISATSALRGIWGSSGTDIWAVGVDGKLMHSDGFSWAPPPVASGTDAFLDSVWGSGPDDVWVVGREVAGGGIIRHWNGGVWEASQGAAAELQRVHGSAASDVWAVGDAGTILHWRGAAWAPSPVDTGGNGLKGVWASAANDAWAVGDGGTIVHWKGSAWSAEASGTGNALAFVWGSAANDVWAVGTGGTIVHWNGSAWTPVTSGTTKDLTGVWGRSSTNVWAVGNGTILHWDGSAWSEQLGTADALGGVWGG